MTRNALCAIRHVCHDRDSNSLNPSRSLCISLLACLLAGSLGCDTSSSTAMTEDESEVSLPIVSGGQLNDYLRSSKSPVLVEFGVDFNCPRCAETKQDIVRLREVLRRDVDVIRVDFNANAQMVAQLGGTVCPTYVLFDQGVPVLTRSYPTTMGLLEGEIVRQLGK